MSARDAILRRVRQALRDVPASEAPADVRVAREYRRSGSAAQRELVEQFAERVADYRATVRIVAPATLAATLTEACRKRGATRLAVPADLPAAWLPAGVEPLPDHGLSYAELDGCDGVLTGCTLAVAQSGTIILSGGPGEGRRALTLLPDYHLCVVRAEQIVALLPEAVARLEPLVRAERRPLTLISGPSATSDIELNRVEGVHGPRTLEVVIVYSVA